MMNNIKNLKFYDITRELFSTPVYPGDPIPEHEWLKQIKNGDSSNLTYLKMCAHNATHMDAPRHFIEGGRTIGELELTQVMGACSVAAWDGMLDAETARELIAGKQKKLLLKGMCVFREDTAQVFADAGIELLGVERQTVGPENDTKGVHKILLGADMALIEGLCLDDVEPGEYFLCAQPLKMDGVEGSPCRAVLIDGFPFEIKVKKKAENPYRPLTEDEMIEKLIKGRQGDKKDAHVVISEMREKYGL